MDAKTFNAILQDQLDICTRMLSSKAEEYASEYDRLANFKTASALQHVGWRPALGGMMAKHTVSIYDMIDRSDLADMEVWTEKITDHINYLILLRALVHEEIWETRGPSNIL